MYIKIIQHKTVDYHTSVSLQCPNCGHYGLFQALSKDIEIHHNGAMSYLGQRKCPRPECVGHLFFIYQNGQLYRTYPAQTIAFDATNIPERILNAFQEAITCHSNNCFIASAIMIRKTLEEICEEKGAEGSNLYQKLQDLSTKIVVPNELKEAMNELRLVGNDAAHIEARTFEEIGKTEIEISIDFTKEILKAIYQYESLLTKLRSLKRPDL